MASGRVSGKRAAARLGMSTASGWLFAYGGTALGTVAMTRAGLLSIEAANEVCLVVAFPAFTAVLLWAFAARSALVSIGLGASGIVMTGVSWFLAR